MDDMDEFFGLIEAQKRTLAAAKTRKGQKATDKASRRSIEATYRKSASDLGFGYSVKQCFISYAYPPSTTPLKDLQPITLSELRLETHHTGRVLVVRTFTHAIHLVSVQAGVEDEAGDVDHLALYNCDPTLQPAQVMPQDTIYAVKEPFYKVSAAGEYIVRVDHPSDLIKLAGTHEMVPLALQPCVIDLELSAEALKLEGNQAYKAKNYLAAFEKYSRGLEACLTEDTQVKSDLLRNRSIVNLYLHRYEPAAADALASVISTNDLSAVGKKNNAKAYYRAGCAFYKQESFKDALDRFQQSLSLQPGDPDGLREIKRTESRLREETHGDYNFLAISKTASSKHNRLDHASFLAKVEVRPSKKHGRGLFAAADLMAGDVVMVDKAFLVAFSSDKEAETYTVLNLNTNSGAVGTQATLTFSLTQKMLHNPAAAAKYFNLYDGGYEPKCKPAIVDGVTVIDTFQAAAIREYNAFGSPNLRSTDKPQASEMESDPRSASGVWLTASYVNHACASNAIRSYIGDLMIVRATKDIAKGTEITMPYHAVEMDPVETCKVLQKAWKFKCDCELCIVEAKTVGSDLAQRRQLVREGQAFLTSNRQSALARPGLTTIAKAQRLYDQLKATYDEKLFENMPRLGLIDLGLWLLSAQPQNGNTKIVIDRAIEVLRSCGYGIKLKGRKLEVDRSHCYMHSGAMDAAMHAAHAHYFKGDMVVGRKFEEFGKELYVTRGGTLMGFVERYGGGDD